MTTNYWDLEVLGIGIPTQACAANVEARTTSRVVTPKRRVGSKTPAFFKVSAATGTVELAGLVTTQEIALGQVAATPTKMSRIMLALVCWKLVSWELF